jgi:DNA repair protein RadC
MNREEAIRWLQAILDDTLDPNDDSDAGRREAVVLAIREMTQRARPNRRPATCPKVGEPSPQVTLREKIEKRGERSLSNTELLSLVIGTGNHKDSAPKLAERLLRRYGFETLQNLDLVELRSNRGLGPVRSCRIRASLELGRRAYSPKEEERPALSTPRAAYDQVKDLRKARKEHLVALYLDAQNHLILRETISVGSLNTTRTHPREILQPAIACSALNFILAHNHPSGSLTPSQDDIDFTRAIRRAADIVGISLYDHLIVSTTGWTSLRESQLI